MKSMIKKYQLPMSFTLKVNPMKEEYAKHIHDSKIIAPSVAWDHEGDSECQRVNRKSIKTLFKSEYSGSDQSKFSRTILGGHLSEEKSTRSLEVELKYTLKFTCCLS